MSSPRRSVVIHGHFYQPPREDPWTGEVPRQPSAAPFHDWNERIERECYGPVTSARVLDDDGELVSRMNALAHMSFDFGPTLLAWLERMAPATYEAVLAADRESCERLDGHGNAMAMAFHHPILPLAHPRDRRTEILWGIADFRRRFARDPEGMWLPETAVDSPTLAALAREGIRFTVLAPHQVRSVPRGGRPGLVRTAQGDITVFVYDGGLSHGVAFGDLVRDGAAWAAAMGRPLEGQEVPGDGGRTLRAVCTDGETFGHHHTFGEMGLASALMRLEGDPGVRVENFASFLAHHPPREEVELVEPSAWSCAHGVERWRSACGCRADAGAETSQRWRAPLRAGFEALAGALHDRFDAEGAALLRAPWGARDAYGAIASLTPGRPEGPEVDAFLDVWCAPGLDAAGRARALDLLEMERDALRLFTSCAWFFDDLARVEPRQVLAYAAHAIGLAGGDLRAEERSFLAILEGARANDPRDGTARDILTAIIESRAGAVAR